MDTRHRVLFVDDEEGVRRSWNRYLSERGFDVTTAEDGGIAISRLREKPVDVVVADLKMPGVDGVELLEWVQQSQPDTRFILLTGYGTDEIERRVRALGAYDYLNKPINPEALSAVITAALHLDMEEETGSEAPGKARGEEVSRADSAAARDVELDVGVREEAVEAVQEEQAKQSAWRFLTGPGEVVGGLVAAPILGLLFVMFLPVIGFGAILLVAGEALLKPRQRSAT